MEAGEYPIEFTMWEGFGHAFAEVFVAQGAVEDFIPGVFQILSTQSENVVFDRLAGLELVAQTPANGLGDADGDGDVDLNDVNAVRNFFGGNGFGDADGDLDVDLDDLNAVRDHFGVTYADSVPEPATSQLLAWLSAFVVLARRRRMLRSRQSRSDK